MEKIIALKNGYDLNISEEEIRKNFAEHVPEIYNCQYVNKGSYTSFLYATSLPSIDGTIKYDYGEGLKTFNKKEFHPKTKEEIIDKQLIDSFLLSFTEKDCLKSGTKLSDDNYQICWCEKISLSSEGVNPNNCLPYRINTFQERLKKEMFNAQKKIQKLKINAHVPTTKAKL